MCTSMHASFSSTLVTVWAFKRNCFLIKVSMSTPLRSFRVSLVGNYEGKPMRSALQTPVNPQPEAFKGPEVPLHFSDRNQQNNRRGSALLVHSSSRLYANAATDPQGH